MKVILHANTARCMYAQLLLHFSLHDDCLCTMDSYSEMLERTAIIVSLLSYISNDTGTRKKKKVTRFLYNEKTA